MILCDTNILIESYRNNRRIIEILKAVKFENVAISDVTRAELLVGARNKHELQTYIKELHQLTQYPICSTISTFSIELLESYHLSHGLDFHDALIAATSLLHNLELYTLNVKDFIFIPGMKLYHP